MDNNTLNTNTLQSEDNTIASNIIDDVNDATQVDITTDDLSKVEQENIAELTEIPEQSHSSIEKAQIIDGKYDPVTKIEALIMFLSIVLIIFTCSFYAVFNINSKLDNLMNATQLSNYQLTQIQSDVQEITQFAQKEIDSQTPFLGISFLSSTQSDLFGIKVDSVFDASPAQKAGIQSGDYILAIDGEKVDSAAKLSNIITAHGVDDTIQIAFATVDDNQIVNKTVKVKLAARSNFDIQE